MSLEVFGILALVFGVLLAFLFGRPEGEDLRKWCESQGHELIGSKSLMTPIHKKYGKSTPGMMEVTVRTSNGEVEVFKVEYGGDTKFRRIPSHGAIIHEAGSPDHEVMDLVESKDEARVLMEISKRMDRITSEPGWADKYDLDGSGDIDTNELQVIRAQIEAEVRAELAEEVLAVPEVASDGESVW